MTQSDPALNTEEDSNVNNLNRRTRRRLDEDCSYASNENDNNSLLAEMSRLFANSERQQNSKFARLEARMADILEQNSKIQDSISFISQKYDDLLERLDVSERENSALKKHIQSMDIKLEHLERQSRSTMLEINNFPATEPENKESLSTTLCKISVAINQPIAPSDIKNIYRLKPKTDQHPSAGMVVAELISNEMKESILKASREYNKNHKDSKLSTSTIQFAGPPHPIYISESLTSYGKHLFYLGRKLQKESKCESCWSSHGKIYIKKNARSSPLCINSEQELTKIMASPKWLDLIFITFFLCLFFVNPPAYINKTQITLNASPYTITYTKLHTTTIATQTNKYLSSSHIYLHINSRFLCFIIQTTNNIIQIYQSIPFLNNQKVNPAIYIYNYYYYSAINELRLLTLIDLCIKRRGW